MKIPRLLLLVLLIGLFVLMCMGAQSCTDNQKARSFGGTEKIALPKGERLVNATWKDNNLWYLTEPMPENYTP